MPNQEYLDPAERELEAALARLDPSRAAIDRDALLFHAGQASVRRHCRAWQSTSAVLGGCLALALIWQPAPRQTPPIVSAPAQSPMAAELVETMPAPAPRPFDAPEREATYITLRNEVLACGIDVLPEPPALAATGTEPPPILDDVLELPVRYRAGARRSARGVIPRFGDGS